MMRLYCASVFTAAFVLFRANLGCQTSKNVTRGMKVG